SDNLSSTVESDNVNLEVTSLETISSEVINEQVISSTIKSDSPNLLDTVWQDIEKGRDLSVVPINYQISSLSSKIYDIIDDKEARREVLKKSKGLGIYHELTMITKQRDMLKEHPALHQLK